MKYLIVTWTIIFGLLFAVMFDYQPEIQKAEAHNTTRILNKDDRDAHNIRHEIVRLLREQNKQNKEIIQLLEKIERRTR